MKSIQQTILLFLLISLTNSSFSQKPRTDINGNYLLKTQWSGNGIYCKYTPENHTLGCHSTAIAQLLYYHKLTPTGKVNYQCSKGYIIDEDFSSYSVNWNKLSTKLTDSSQQEFIAATAYYNYMAACIVQKDFGTSQYVDIENSKNHMTQIEKHFTCKYTSYTYNTNSTVLDLFKENKSIKKLIEKEIDVKRPLGFYYDGPDFIGHAIVIDGYEIRKQKFYVHANFGWSGSSDGWYLFPEDLPKATKTIMLLTIEPN